MENKESFKIAVNTRALMKGKLDGIGWFTYQVVKRWVENNPQHTFYFLFDRPYDESFVFGKNVVPIIIPPPARHPILWYIWYEWMIPARLKKINPDIFISLDTYTSTRWKGKKITGIHDVAFALFDGQVGAFTQWFLRFFTPKYIQTSDKIVTVSHASKNDLVRVYHCPVDKIIISNNAPAEEYKPLKVDEIIQFKETHTGGNDFFLFVGSIHPRKNVLTLLRAFEQYRRTHSSNEKLVLIGRMSWKYSDVKDYLDQMEFKHDVIQISHSTPLIISQWMASTKALMLVSFYEGFGVPLVEAMACGVPIICSNVSSMPEVVGEAAMLVSPKNENEIVEAMKKISTDNELRDRLIANGKNQVLNYTWDAASEIIWKNILQLVER